MNFYLKYIKNRRVKNNTRSIRAGEKAGFTLTEKLRNEDSKKGEYDYIMAIKKEDYYFRMKLTKRNQRIIQAVIAKMEKACPGSVALIGIGGSFFSGDIHEKSEYIEAMLSDDMAKCRYSSALLLYYLEFSL